MFKKIIRSFCLISSYLSVCLLTVACTSPGQAPKPGISYTSGISHLTWVDLSHPYDQSTLYWPNNVKGFEHHAEYEGQTAGNYFYSSYSISTPEHGGTHLDAPKHFSQKGWSVDQIPLQSLIGNTVVIDVSDKAKVNPDYLIQISDITAWENLHGKIAEQSIILFQTGYWRYYPNRKQYFGTDKTGLEAIAHLHFPGISPGLSTWLVEQRKPKAVGIDTASIDYGQSKDFQTHRILLGSNILGFENLTNLDKLPPKGAFIVALPMKISGGSGGPLRIVAGLPSQ